MDRRSLERKLDDLQPDEVEQKKARTYQRYYMASVVKHLMGVSQLDYAAERTRLTKEQADKTEMENAVNRGELQKSDDLLRIVGGHIHATKTKLLAMPSQISSFLAHKEAADIQSQLTDAIHDTLTELSEGVRGAMDPAEAPESQ